MELNLDFVRKQFPALKSEWTFFDNAGGSQTLQTVIDRLGEYLTTSDVQPGGSYEPSQIAGKRVQEGFKFVKELLNARDVSEVIFGSSTTQLLRQLSVSFVQTLKPGDEIIVSNTEHEANAGPWVNLQDQGIIVKFWEVNPDTLELDIEELKKLFSHKTRFVAVTHASNILGTINPIKEIAKIVHQHNAYLCVDAVAYAPHRLPDVQDLDVDFYVFSFYKVYGPHYAALYGRREILEKLPNINHFFIQEDDIPYKLQPGSANYELSYSFIGYRDYLEALVKNHFPEITEPYSREAYEKVYELFTKQETKLTTRLLDFLNSKSNVKIIGKTSADEHERVSTVSFVLNGEMSSSITEKVDAYKIGIRYGDFYARRLIDSLDYSKSDGVIRVSMVHYNTVEEVDRLIETFDRLF